MKLDDLELEGKLFTKLLHNKIDTIEKLCRFDKKSLKELDFTYDEINCIMVKLQLNGFDLSKRKVLSCFND